MENALICFACEDESKKEAKVFVADEAEAATGVEVNKGGEAFAELEKGDDVDVGALKVNAALAPAFDVLPNLNAG